MFDQLLKTAAIIGAIPFVGYLIAAGILTDMGSGLEDGVTVESICAVQRELARQGNTDAISMQAACDQVRRIVLLREASVWSAIVSIGLMLLYAIAAFAAGTNRKLNAAIFPKLIPVSLSVIAGLVIVEGAILTYGAFVGESYVIGRVHFVLIGGVGLAALIGAFSLIDSMLSLRKGVSQQAFGLQVPRSDEPGLWQFVEQLAGRLGSRVPDNIIVGLEPTFYATAASVHLLNEDRKLSGETMYLSLPLMRLFSTEQLRAVIGHELGHFSGADTAYSLKFAPVYSGLAQSIHVLSGEAGFAAWLARLPALTMLSLMLELFARNESRISQERELLADKAGVSVSSPEALSVALGKVAIYAPRIWLKVRERNVDRLNAGKVTGNLCRVYEDSARYDVSHSSVVEVREAILATKIAHPTDTHPTMSERLENIGYNADGLTVEKLTTAGNSSAELLDNVDKLEEGLTLLEHRLMVALGYVRLPEEDAGKARAALLNAVYALVATMVGADGRIDQAEIAVAERIGKEMFPDFDSVDFRACCSEIDSLAAFGDIVAILDGPLKVEHKAPIYDYLEQIALADGELAEEERTLLASLREQ